MEDSPTLGVIDLLTGKHGLDHLSKVRLSRQFYKQFNGLFGNPVLGVVEQDVIETQ